MGMERHCHSDAQFPRCWAKLTETFVADGRCETAAALLARPPAFLQNHPASAGADLEGSRNQVTTTAISMPPSHG